MTKKFLMTALAGAAALMPMAASAGQGDWIVRARAINVAPDDSAGPVDPGFPGGSVDVDAAVVPELDFTYFLTDRVAAELILATSPHDISGTGDLDALGTVGEVMVLPPTLTLQYHFAPGAEFAPYVGLGVNYTLFYDEETSDSLDDAIGATSLSLDESFGIAGQVGVDIALKDDWVANIDLKYIQIETEATLDTGGVINTVDVDINPFVFGIGIGKRF